MKINIGKLLKPLGPVLKAGLAILAPIAAAKASDLVLKGAEKLTKGNPNGR